MKTDWQNELKTAIWSGLSLEEIVAMLRRYKEKGVAQGEIYATLEALRTKAPNDAVDDQILEVADFVAGFCSPHMRIWEN